MLIDLQLHSTYSDGYLRPADLVKFIASQGVKVAALTDHNTIGGWVEFKTACKKTGIKPVMGLELYTKVGRKKVNLLWYNFDETDVNLHKLLHEVRMRRRDQVRKFLNKLQGFGFVINTEKILDKYNHYIPINHIVDDLVSVPKNLALIKKQHNLKDVREEDVIRKYFFNPKIGLMHESYINIERVIKLRKKVGGQLVHCHPGKNNQLKLALLEKLKALKIDGIEVLSPHHNLGATMYAQFIAKKMGFIMTGGSDFHRHESGSGIKNCYNYFRIDSKNLKGVERIITN